MKKVKFYMGTKETFDKLFVKDPDGLYYIDGLLYKGDNLYTRRYERVTAYPLYGEDNVTYVNIADGSVKYWENGGYKDICHPIVQKLDKTSTQQQLVSAKAVYDCIISNTKDLNIDSINSLIEDKIGYLEGNTVKDYIKLLIDNLVDGAPDDLNTLKKLSDALKSQADDIEALKENSIDIDDVRLKSEAITEDDLDYKLIQKINNSSGGSGGDITVTGAQIDDKAPSYSKVYSSQTTENKIKDAVTKGVNSISFNEITVAERNKLAAIEPNANNYKPPLSYSAEIIDQTDELQFVSETEKENYSDKYTKSETDNLLSSLSTGLVWKESVDTYEDITTTYPKPVKDWCVSTKNGVYLYDGSKWIGIGINVTPLVTKNNDGLMSKSDKSKLDTIAENANNYKHPSTHSADIITETTDRKFVNTELYNKLSNIDEQLEITLKDYRDNETKITEADIDEEFLKKLSNAGGTVVNDELLSLYHSYSSAKIELMLSEMENNVATFEDVDALFQ